MDCTTERCLSNCDVLCCITPIVLGQNAPDISQSCTIITGRYTIGEVIPPNFLFLTKVKILNCKKKWLKTAWLTKKEMIKFEYAEVKNFTYTFWLNKKGGMGKDGFEKYFFNSIAPLYPQILMSLGNEFLLISIVNQGGLIHIYWLVFGRLWVLIVWQCRVYQIL